MILVGEVHTGLLRKSAALTAGGAAAVLELKPGAPVSYGDRPVRFAVSPDLFTGVDCSLASTHATPRGIGTVGSRATIIGGQVLQGSSFTTLIPAPEPRRLPWSHYLAQPAVVETVGRFQPDSLGQGFLHAPIPPSTLDLGAVNARLVKLVQARPGLDKGPAFRAQPARLRWSAREAKNEDPSVTFSIQRNTLRTVELRCVLADLPVAVAICEDIAFHDWLLTTLIKLLDHSMIGAAPRRDVVGRLLPAVDFILHLWMPGARLDGAARLIWQGLEERAGFSRQWAISVDRVRDQFSSAMARPQFS